MKFTARLAYIFLIPILVNSSCPAQSYNNQSVANVEGGYSITFPEVKKYFYDHLYNKIYKDNKLGGYNKALDELIIRQLKIIDFFKLGFNDNKDLLRSIRRVINEELVVQYFRTQFYEKYVNDKSIREAYENMGKEVLYRQIVLKKLKDTAEYSDSLRVKANDIRIQINNGADFSELINKYSQNSDSYSSNVYSVDWEKSLSNTSDYLIFNLDAGDVRILEAGESIIIVKIVEIKKTNVPPFDEVKDDILKTLDERYVDISLEDFDNEKSNLVDESTFEWDQKNLQQIVKWSNNPAFYKQSYKDTLQNSISSGKNFLILKHSKGKVDLEEYLRLLDEVLILGNSDSLTEDDLKKFIVEAVRTDLAVKKAGQLNLEKEILNPGTANSVLKSEIARLYNIGVIEAQIPEATGKALRQFYAENKDSLFYQFEKVNIYAFISPDSELLNNYRLKLDQNIPFEKVSDRFFVKTFIKDHNGNIKSFLSREKPFLGEAAFNLHLSEISGPIEYDDTEKGKQFAIIKCVNKVEAKQLLYEDVEKTIGEEFVKFYRNKIAKEVHQQLKNKYAVNIFQDVLEYNLSVSGF